MASTSVAALLLGCGAPAMAACTQVTSGGVFGTTAGLCVTNTSFSGSIETVGNISPSGITFTNGTMTGEISQFGGTISGISLDSHSAIIGVSETAAIALQGFGFDGFSGSISNAGIIAASNTHTIYIKNIPNVSGSISNSGTISGGRIAIQVSTVTQFGSSSIGGGITNSGTIAGRSTGIFLRRLTNFSGGISNSGTISGEDGGIVVGGTNTVGAITNFAGGISNSGTISASRAINVQNVSTFSGGISNSGTISAGSTDIAVFNHGTFSGGISNSGAISASGGISNSGAISARSFGIRVNSATLIGGTSAGGGISNSGTISVSGIGIEVAGATTSGGISNSGTISAGSMGILVGTNDEAGNSPTFLGGITNSGTIFGSAQEGIFVGGGDVGAPNTIPTFTGGITNSGTISLSGGQNYGILVGGFVAVDPVTISTFGGGISNSGTIAASSDGILVGAFNNFSSVTVSNFSGGIGNSGTIMAGGAGILVGGSGVTISTFSGNIANSGQISAATGIAVGSGVTFAPGSAIVNTGTITGTNAAIDASGATMPVTTDQEGGLLSGAVKLSAHADQLNISGGTINGDIIGHGSSDAINFNLGSDTFTYGAAYGFSGVNQVNVNSGLIILDGANSAATVTANGGTLEVGDAANPGATLTAANPIDVYGTLAGHGTVTSPSVTVESGGTLMPGGSIGTLTINGNVTFAPNANYAVEIASAQSSRTQVNGGVTLGDASVTITGVMASNQYGLHRGGQTYRILTDTAGGIGGANQFNPSVSIVSSTPSERVTPSGAASLSYDANDVYLNLPTYAVTLQLAPNGSANAQNVAGALNAAILNGAAIPAGFQNLANLSGTALNTAVTQLGGQPGLGTVTTGFMADDMFLNMVLDPFVDGRDQGFGPGVGSAIVANDSETPLMAAPALAYGEDPVAARANAAFGSMLPTRKGPLPAPGPQLTFWGGSYGGVGSITGNAATGAAGTQNQIYGLIAGLDDHIAPDTMIGFALGGGGTSWQLNQGYGAGHSGMGQASVYGSKRYGPAYVSGAFAYSYQGVSTSRLATLAGSGTLDADFGAHVLSSRVETGYRLPAHLLPGLPANIALTPYAAVQAQAMFLPSYSEYAATSSNQFALSYAARDYSTIRTELGSWFETDLVIPALPFTQSGALKAYGRAAWAHDFNNESTSVSFFQPLPGSSFLINSAKPSANSALVTAGLEYRLADGWSIMTKFDGEYSATTSIFAGTGVLRKVW